MWSFHRVFSFSPQSNRSLVNRPYQRPSCLSLACPLWILKDFELVQEWRVHKWVPTPFIHCKTLLLFEGKIPALETEWRQAFVLFLTCCFFVVPVLLEDLRVRGVVWQAASVERFYSYSLIPAVSNQSPCLFSKSSKLHKAQRSWKKWLCWQRSRYGLRKERSNLFLWK